MIPFCRVIRPTNKRYGFAGSMPCRCQCVYRRDLAIFVEIDAVMNDVQTFGPNLEQPFDVAFRFRRNRDHGIRHFQRGLLQPDGKIVTTAELLALPRP